MVVVNNQSNTYHVVTLMLHGKTPLISIEFLLLVLITSQVAQPTKQVVVHSLSQIIKLMKMLQNKVLLVI